jgi:enterochelin esterase-like enzyme
MKGTMLSKISQRMMPLAGICFSLASQAALAQRIALQPCAEEKLPFPAGCIVPQSAPFKNVQLKPGMNVQAVDEYLVVSWLGPAQKVTLDTLEIYDPLPLVADDLRQVVIRYPGAPKFNSGVGFRVVQLDGRTVKKYGSFHGPQAVSVPETAETPGEIVDFGETLPRAQVWLPPGYQAGRHYPIVYVADSGDNRGALAAAAIRMGELEPVIVVGVDACARTETDQGCRLQHYIEENSGPDVARFRAYEKFFILTLVPKVESTYGRPVDATQRAINGYSAGGSWAASMALRNPDLFGRAIAMSPSPPMLYRVPPKTRTVFAMSGGELEPTFSIHAQCFAGTITDAGGTASLRLYPAGHSEPMWGDEFMAAMRDWLGVPRQQFKPAPSRPSWCPPFTG